MFSEAPILLVEDDDADAFFLQRAIQKLQIPFPLDRVTDGQSAIDYLARKGRFEKLAHLPVPRLVVLDLKMPICSGFDVLEWVRSQTSFQHLKVAVWSSSTLPEDKAKAMHLGASDFVVKPAKLVEYESIIQKWLSGSLLPSESGLLPDASPGK
jgi:chemotaxis family two-component system response regulator Rcp1